MGSGDPSADAAALRLEVERLRRLLDETQLLARLGTYEYDVSQDKVFWSDELFRIYGYEPGEVVPSRELALARTHPGDYPRLREWGDEMLAHPGVEREIDIRVLLPDGTERPVRQRGVVAPDATGAPVRLVGTVQDWTSEARSRRTETLLAQIVSSVSDAIYTADSEARLRSWNPGAERLYGYTAEEAIGQPLYMLFPESVESPEWQASIERSGRMLYGIRNYEEYETTRRRKDGSLVDVAVTTSPLRDHTGEIIGVVASARDISERRRIEAQLTHHANHDMLTGLFNRRRFEEELAAAAVRAEQEGHSCPVLAIDLDNFRYVNEAHGHSTGDEVVASLGALLRRHLRESDVLARFGGDEFAVLVAPCTEEAAQSLAEQLLNAVRQHEPEIEGTSLRIGASIGVTTFASRDTDVQTLLAVVERAMYQSKEAGRNRVTFVTPAQRTQVREQLNSSSEHMIHSALDQDLFELYVQPIADLRSGEMTHVEVLLRLNANGEVIGPGQFLPAAERLGLIHLIDRWVIDRALALVAQHDDLVFELNLSGATIDDDQLCAYVEDRLNAHGSDPGRVVFEITETAAVGNITKARELAHAISRLGCTFAIDDFGTGFSTFYYLKHFPAQYVKIDGEFLSEAQSRLDDLVIESIVRIGRELGKQTIAEYVSDESRLERVRRLGVDYAQGFFLSKPFPAPELAAFPRQLLKPVSV